MTPPTTRNEDSMKPTVLPRLVLLGAVGTAALLVAACGGGGGGGGMIPGDLDATFTSNNAAPPAGSISMQAGASPSDLFDVRIVATGITDLFGTMFRVNFNSNVATFVSLSSAGSVLGGVGVITNFEATTVSAGLLEVTAERVPGGGGGVGFTAASPSPAANTISLQPGSVNGDEVTILVRATNVTDLFGTAFRVTFDGTTADFVGPDSTGSLFLGAGIQTQFSVGEVSNNEIAVVATRVQNMQGTVPGVNVSGTQTIIALTFEATGLTSGNSFTLAQPREACSSASTDDVCVPIAVNWSGGTLTNTAGDAGVDVPGSGDLVTLRFRATQAVTGSAFDFADLREVCSSASLPGCTPIAVTYIGGALTAN